MANNLREAERWFIKEKEEEYSLNVLKRLTGNIDSENGPIIPHKRERNGVAETFNRTIMNSVRVSLRTAGMRWSHWTWTQADVTDKYNQLPQSATLLTSQ